MQALFQLSYSPTRTRMLHEPDGLACDLIGRPKDRPDRVQSTTLGALRRYACKVATTTTEWRAILRLPGGPLECTIRRSTRARLLRLTVDPRHVAVVTVPARAARNRAQAEHLASLGPLR